MDSEHPYRRKSRITVPAVAHPLAKFCFAEMKRQAITYVDLEWKSGVLVSTWKAWRKNNRPGLESLESVLGALGYTLVPVPTCPDTIPQPLRVDLQTLAAKHGLSTWPALEFVTEWSRFTWPDCTFAERRRLNKQLERQTQ